MTRAEELALEAYDRMFHNPERMSVRSVVYPTEGTLDYREPFKPFFLDVYQQGYEKAEKDLGWHSVEESLPEVDEEVIVLSDVIHGKKVEGANMICFGHIVDKRYCVDYDGWNFPGVHHWMPCPKIPNEI